MRGRSVAHRLDQLSGYHHAGDRERLIHEMVGEYGLSPVEVRAELAVIEGRARRYGPEAPERFVRRCAEELGLPEAEVRDEYDRVAGRARVAR